MTLLLRCVSVGLWCIKAEANMFFKRLDWTSGVQNILTKKCSSYCCEEHHPKQWYLIREPRQHQAPIHHSVHHKQWWHPKNHIEYLQQQRSPWHFDFVMTVPPNGTYTRYSSENWETYSLSLVVQHGSQETAINRISTTEVHCQLNPVHDLTTSGLAVSGLTCIHARK